MKTLIAAVVALGLLSGARPPGSIGSAGSAKTLHVVAIGDSLPYGRDDCGGCATFIDLFGRALARATGASVVVRNLSEHTGIDSGDLRHELVGSAGLRSAVAGADAITVTIGHNDPPWNSYTDSCDGKGGYPKADWSKYDAPYLRSSVGSLRANFDAILKQIRALGGGKATLLRVTDDYNDLIGDSEGADVGPHDRETFR